MEVSGQLHAPTVFTAGEATPATYCTGPRTGSDAVTNVNFSVAFGNRTKPSYYDILLNVHHMGGFQLLFWEARSVFESVDKVRFEFHVQSVFTRNGIRNKIKSPDDFCCKL
jgi:hypothetical protein